MKSKLLKKNFIGSSMKKFVLIAVGVLAIYNSYAYDFEVDGIFYNKLSENTVEVTYKKYGGFYMAVGDSFQYGDGSYEGAIDIPTEISEDGLTYRVTSIGEGVFYKCSKVVSVTIPYIV